VAHWRTERWLRGHLGRRGHLRLDGLKGRAKQVAGKLLGNKRLEREGKVDWMAGRVKRAVDRVKGALTGPVHRSSQAP